MEITRYIVIPIILFTLSLLFTVIYYFWNRTSYLKNRVLMRKVYYLVVIILSLLLFVLQKFPFTTNAELVAYVISVILIDLMVFQTPDITKFMSNELKQEELAQTIEKNEGTLHVLTDKIICVNEAMPKSTKPWEVDSFDFSYEAYEDFLLNYLKTYTNSFNIHIFSYYVESSDTNEGFVENIQKAYDKIRNDHGFSIRGVGMRRKRLIQTLSRGENVEIVESGRPYVLFPYFGEYYNFLFVLSGKEETSVTGADASLLLNMIYMFDYWLISNEHDLVNQEEDEDDSLSNEESEAEVESGEEL